MDSGPLASRFRTLLTACLCEKLGEQLVIRNGICHGLVGFSAEHDGKPASLTWELNGEKRNISWDDLQTACLWLSRVPVAVRIISNGGDSRPGCRMFDSKENRDWWNTEYAISLRDL